MSRDSGRAIRKRGLRLRFIRRARLFLAERHGITFPNTPKHSELCDHVERVIGYEPRQQFSRIEQAVAAMEGKMDFTGRIGKTALRSPKVDKAARSAFYESREWRSVRYDVLRANDGRCELCGVSKHDGAKLHVDHILPRSKYPDLELEPTNLQVLCEPCNLGKSNRDETDWRKPGEPAEDWSRLDTWD